MQVPIHTISSATQRLLRYAMLKGIGPQALRRIVEEKQFMDALVEQLALNFLPLARALKTPGAWDKALQATEYQQEMAIPPISPVGKPVTVSHRSRSPRNCARFINMSPLSALPPFNGRRRI